MHKDFDLLKQEVQSIIDNIGTNNLAEASVKLIETHEILDDLIDLVSEDEELIQVSYYQVLLNQLHQKIEEKKNKS